MAGNKDEAKQVVADCVLVFGIEGSVEIGHGHLFDCEFAAQFLVLAFEPGVAAEVIDGAMLGGGHKPGSRFVRDA